MKLFKTLILCIFVSCNLYSNIDKNKFTKNPRILIFDGGSTLISFDNMKALKYISSFGSWMFFLKSAVTGTNVSEYLTNFYFENLSKIPSPVKIQHQNIIGPNDQRITPLQTAHLTGKTTQQNAITTAVNWSSNNKNQFENDTLYTIFNQSINLNFDANILINNLKLNTSNVKLLESCFKECDNQGKRKNICIVVANHSKELIPHLKRTFPQIFQFSDAQVFSCDAGYLKPDPRLFECALKLCPNNCLTNCYFIDEQRSVLNAIHRKKVKSYMVNAYLPNEFKGMN